MEDYAGVASTGSRSQAHQAGTVLLLLKHVSYLVSTSYWWF